MFFRNNIKSIGIENQPSINLKAKTVAIDYFWVNDFLGANLIASVDALIRTT